MTYAANDVVLGRHLDTAEKRIKREIDKIAAGDANVAVFTGATAVDGTSGLVPAPLVGDGNKFLRGDGTWATVASGSSSDGYVIGSKVSGVEGGFWQSLINDAPVLKLRHGDYEYNFAYDDLTFAGGASSVIETVTPNTYVIGTASVSNDGGVWYEVNNDIPTLNLHAGNFNYSFNYDSVTYKGDNSHLAAYLPFNVSPTADACGNVWTATGNPTIVDGKLYLNNTSSLTNTTIADSIGSLPWTSDFWFSCGDTANVTYPHRFQLSGGSTSHSIVASCIANNTITINLGDVNLASGITVTANTRYHCALTYDGTTLRLFVNGVLVVTNELAVQLGGSCSIGLPSSGVTIDHFRVFKGQALWTEDFTPPTAEDYL